MELYSKEYDYLAIVGHSLGGAQANIFSYLLAKYLPVFLIRKWRPFEKSKCDRLSDLNYDKCIKGIGK